MADNQTNFNASGVRANLRRLAVRSGMRSKVYGEMCGWVSSRKSECSKTKRERERERERE
jgi:hypothetical protein